MDGAGDGRGGQQSVGPQVKHLDVIVHTQLPKPTCLGREVKKKVQRFYKNEGKWMIQIGTQPHFVNTTVCVGVCACVCVCVCVWECTWEAL